MFGRNLSGRGQGGGAGLGFRGSSPPWPYVGRGRGGLPRCSYYAGSPDTASRNITRDEEISLLKGQAENVKRDLETIESRIRDLESQK